MFYFQKYRLALERQKLVGRYAMKSRAILLCLSLSAAGFAADPVLVDNPATPDELIADQQTLVPSRIPVPFSSFRYPHLDRDLSVTFIADDPYYRGGRKFGIYRSEGSTGKVVKLVNNEDTPPQGSAPFSDFLGLQVEGRKYVFRGVFSEGEGIYGDFGDGLRVIADTKTSAVPAAGAFRTFAYADISGDTAIFVGEDSAGVYGLFSYAARLRTIRRLVDQTTVLPDGSTIKKFNGQPWVDAGSIVFRGSDAQERHGIYRIAKESLAKPETPSVEVLLNHDTPLPVSFTINKLTSAPVEGNITAFVASGLDAQGGDYTGVFFIQGGKITVAADNHTEIPDEKIRFQSFQKWIALENGMIIFRGFGEDGFEGIFAFDSASNELHQLINNRSSVEGRKIQSFEIASNPVIGSRIAFLVVFDDKNDALYLASLKNGPLKAGKEH